MTFNFLTRWVGQRIEIIVASFSVLTVATAFTQKGIVDSEMLILSIQNMSDVVVFLSISLRIYIEMAIYMTSSQRLYEYTSLPQED